MSGGREGWMEWREMARRSDECLEEDKVMKTLKAKREIY